MTSTIVRTSKELVWQTRKDLGLAQAGFGAMLGVTRQMVQQLEAGTTYFDIDRISAGLTSTDPTLRRFWLDYHAIRYRETMATIVARVDAIGGVE